MRRVRALLQLVAACIFGVALTVSAQAQTYARAPERRPLGDRSFLSYAPASIDAATPAPLIVALHGRFSSAAAMHAQSGLAAVAESRGAVIVYPEAATAFWNDGGFEALGRQETPLDDEGFVAAVIAETQRRYAIDAARVFIVGYDAGGGLAYRLACTGTLRPAGIAVVAALMWDYASDACATPVRAPLLIMHGRRDDYFPVRGGAPPGGRIDARRLSANDTVAFWRNALGCAARPDETAGGRSVYFAGCGLAYVGVGNGGHVWFRAGEGYRLNRQGVDAGAAIERFFFDRANFTLPEQRLGARGRSFIVYAPPGYDPAQPMPVLFMLHGRPSNAAGIAAMTQLNEVAARRGFIAVYPDGVGNQWNSFADVMGERASMPQDDVGFLEDLADDLLLEFNVDPRRMFIAGFSNGGFMSLRMACASQRFAGYASVGAPLYTVLTDMCRSSRPNPVLIMHGTGDPSVPYTGVIVRDGQDREPTYLTLSAQRTAAFFINRNHCSMAGASTAYAEGGQSPGTSVVRFAPHNCDANAQVMFWIVNGGGHTWPGVRVLDESAFGPTNMDINAGDAIWDFFEQQRLPDAR